MRTHRKIGFLLLFLLLLFCNKKVRKEKEIDFVWVSSATQYTTPKFLLKGNLYKSQVSFIHQIEIQNISSKLINDNFSSNFYEEFNGNYVQLSPFREYGLLSLVPKDTIIVEAFSAKKFNTLFNSQMLEDSIYKKSDTLLQHTNLVYILNGDTLAIKKSPDFYCYSEKIYPSQPGIPTNHGHIPIIK